ncbi:baseplate J/gp47 family protein [Rouxiella sp. WC2420]|uniref:Baseplate J/gp47 family protein n=1 Tax=Rouxiella sp. WC2420 TaxID=3234145 RepID=A0AB39VKB2_9GAMM
MTDTITITTSVPSVTFSTTGVTAPDELDVLNGRLSDLSSSLGSAMSTSLTTPQGQMAMSEAAIIGDKNDQILAFANQVNPDYSSGRFQDAIGRIYFMTRIAAAGTVVSATCTGLVNTLIPAGSAAQDDAGYIYYSLADAIIGTDGTATVSFQNVTTGEIACAAGNLNTIYKAVDGWSGVINASAGTVGNDVESRANFEYRRKNSVAANAVNSVQAVYAALLAVDGVLDAYVIDNPTGEAVSVGETSYSIPANCIYAAVVGGTASDIATALWTKKSTGCSYVGNTSSTVYDDNYSDPKPSYTPSWVTPTTTPIYFNVEIEANDSLPQNIISLIQDAIVSAFNGDDGGSRARIGATIYSGRYYNSVFSVDSKVNIQSLLLGTTSLANSTSAKIGIDQNPTLDTSNINVTLV